MSDYPTDRGDYQDMDGEPVTLRKLIREEPERWDKWAHIRICMGRDAEDKVIELQAEIAALKREWIPVSSGKLPDFGLIVETFSAGAGNNFDYLTTAGLFTADHPVRHADEVTHWRHRTTPPAQEKE